MKLKYVFVITAAMFFAALAFGLYCKASYLDYNEEEEPLNEFQVGLFPDALLEMQLERMNEILPSSNYILAVRCEGKTFFRYYCTSQSVVVEHVFAGEGLEQGDKIDIGKASSDIFDGDEKSINMGYVNAMIPGNTYLVFLDRKLDTVDEDDAIYITTRELLIAPVFCYQKIESKPCSTIDDFFDSNYYSNVRTNEFFLMSEEGIEKMTAYKEGLLEKYVY